MRQLGALLLSLAFLFLATAVGRSESIQFSIADTDPPLQSTLVADQTLYIRIVYKSDQPLRFRAEGFASGQNITKGAYYNPAPPYPAGEGEALAWIAYRPRTSIDEIRITAANERWQPMATQNVSVRLEWTGEIVGPQPRPEWAARLSQQQQDRTKEQIQNSSGRFDLVLGVIITAALPGYIVLQILTAIWFRGRWRIAALLPLAAFVPLLVHALYALSAGSNLWPILLIFFAPVGCLYLAVLFGARYALSAA